MINAGVHHVAVNFGILPGFFFFRPDDIIVPNLITRRPPVAAPPFTALYLPDERLHGFNTVFRQRHFEGIYKSPGDRRLMICSSE